MISARDRQDAVMLIDEARAAGARLSRACAELGIHRRTYRRWTAEGEVRPDGRPEAKRPTPPNKLSDAERAEVLAACHEPAHASLPPSQIVPKLADQGRYLASEATFYRVLREAGEAHRRGRARAPHQRAKPRHCATGPGQVWSWDIERHEALSDRVTVRDRRDPTVAAVGDKLRAARAGERQRGWQAALTKPGHDSTVGCRGPGEQTRKV